MKHFSSSCNKLNLGFSNFSPRLLELFQITSPALKIAPGNGNISYYLSPLQVRTCSLFLTFLHLISIEENRKRLARIMTK